MRKSSIAKNIKKSRKKLDLTQEKLAIKAEIPYATLSKIESGQVDNPTIKTLSKLAKALDVSLDYLTKE